MILSEVAGFLGIPFSTMRSWAGKGKIRVFRAPRGYSRFKTEDLRRSPKEQANSTDLANLKSVMEAALIKLGTEMDKMPVNDPAWRTRLTDQELQSNRGWGHHLFSPILSFILKSGQLMCLFEDCRKLGHEYGLEATCMGISLAESGRAVPSCAPNCWRLCATAMSTPPGFRRRAHSKGYRPIFEQDSVHRA